MGGRLGLGQGWAGGEEQGQKEELCKVEEVVILGGQGGQGDLHCSQSGAGCRRSWAGGGQLSSVWGSWWS